MGTSLGTLPSSGSTLGNSPGASTSTPRQPRRQQNPNWQPPQQNGQAGSQSGTSTGQSPQTFAQMQQQGMARPAPPPSATPSTMNPQGSAMSAGPSSSQASPSALAQQGLTPPTPGPLASGTSNLMPSTTPPPAATGTAGDVGSQLQTSVQNALAAPSRYDLPQVQQVQQALTAQLQQQFNASQTQLNEQMAARGLSASSIGAGYQGDLTGQDNTALANMNASLIQNQAATSAADQAAALSAGQSYQTGQQNYGLNQGSLTGVYNGQQTLGAQTAAAQNALGFGQLMGSVNGQATLPSQQLMQNQNQFTASQAQAASIAAAQNATANRGVDAEASLAQNQLMLQVANFLAANGYPGGTTPASGSGLTGNTGSSPAPTTGTTGTTGNTGSTAPPGGIVNPNAATGSVAPPTSSFSPPSDATGANFSISAPPTTTTFDPTGTNTGSPTGVTAPPYTPPAPQPFGTTSPPVTTTPPASLPSTSSLFGQLSTTPPPASPPTGVSNPSGYQIPVFGNSSYTGLFGNAPVQYGSSSFGAPASSPASALGSDTPSLFGQAPSSTGTGYSPPPTPSAPTGLLPQVTAALNPSGPPPTQTSTLPPGQVTSGNPMTAGTNGAVWSGTQTPYQQQEIGGTSGETVSQYLAGQNLRNGPQQLPGSNQPPQQYAMQSFFPNVDFNKLPANTTLGQLLSAGAITKAQLSQAFADGNPNSIPDNWPGLGETIGATTGF